jgi:hypothetical protein
MKGSMVLAAPPRFAGHSREGDIDMDLAKIW